LIALAQLRMRRTLERESPERLKLRMWLYPWLTVFSLVAIAAIVVSMAFVDDEATRSYLIPSLISLGVVLVAAVIRQRTELARPERRKAAAAGSLPGRQLGGVR
jgi:GABA permease